MTKQTFIKNFPINFFASVMGFAGVTMSLKSIEGHFQLPAISSTIFMILTSLLFIVNGGILLMRLIYHHTEVVADFNHPVKMNFFATISIGLLLMGFIYLKYSPTLAFIVWLLGALLQISLTLVILSKLIWTHHFTLDQFNAAWLIPIVGNIIVPIAGVQFISISLNWIFFSIGIVFSIIYFTLFFNRSFFHSKIPNAILPTYFILMAPPAIGFTSYLQLSGELNGLAYTLYGTAFFIGLLLIGNLKKFVTVPFSMAWWAYLFPSAAMTGATIQMFQLTGDMFFQVLFCFQIIGIVLLALFNLVKTILVFKNGQAG